MSQNRLIAEWEEQPYTNIKRRRATVEHRVLLDVYPGGNVDVRHEIRAGDDNASVPEEWTPADVWEVRGGRVNHLNRRRTT